MIKLRYVFIVVTGVLEINLVKHQTIEAVSSLSFPQFLTWAYAMGKKVPDSLIITRYGPH